jgi:hypothetical protein
MTTSCILGLARQQRHRKAHRPAACDDLGRIFGIQTQLRRGRWRNQRGIIPN